MQIYSGCDLLDKIAIVLMARPEPGLGALEARAFFFHIPPLTVNECPRFRFE